MSIVSFNYFFFISIFLFIYYLINEKYQWLLLLIMSILFYYINVKLQSVWILFSTLGIYLFTNILYKYRHRLSKSARRAILCIDIFIILFPLLLLKYIIGSIYSGTTLPLGISFYSLQLIGYSVDIYTNKYEANCDFFHFLLFALFFPHIIQGPIARYNQLSKSLFAPHKFNEKTLSCGFMLIIWGLFLKLVLADSAAIFVNTVYANYKLYTGIYILLAGVLYSIQLYADFMGCVCIARGSAYMFGVELMENFDHPYFSTSIKDFWRRWHISLSSWLRDYIYIPLGGNRKGKIRKYINLIITFLISGFWHGVGFQFIFWGMLHAIYQIIGEITLDIRLKIKKIIKLKNTLNKLLQQVITFILVMLAWIVFRATCLSQALEMFVLLTKNNVSNINLFNLGLSVQEFIILIASIIILISVSNLQKKYNIREKILSFPLPLRYFIYIVAICIILIFGRYGNEYDAGQFIYGGF